MNYEKRMCGMAVNDNNPLYGLDLRRRMLFPARSGTATSSVPIQQHWPGRRNPPLSLTPYWADFL